MWISRSYCSERDILKPFFITNYFVFLLVVTATGGPVWGQHRLPAAAQGRRPGPDGSNAGLTCRPRPCFPLRWPPPCSVAL